VNNENMTVTSNRRDVCLGKRLLFIIVSPYGQV
jgi:hypothetical protein